MNPSTIFKELKRAVLATLVLAVLLCGIYPVLVWGIGKTLFPSMSSGSLVIRDGRVLGSLLIGQNFTGPRYFHPRPSAAGDGYDGANSGGSNLGPLSEKLSDQVKERIAAYRAENGLAMTIRIPADAVTASASGLDPHITVENAEIQAGRVARARGIPEILVCSLIRTHTEGPDLGFLGERRVNVFELNLALDAEKG